MVTAENENAFEGCAKVMNWKKVVFRLFFLGIHVGAVSAVVVFTTYDACRGRERMWRSINQVNVVPGLKKVYSAIELQKQESGEYPASIDEVLKFDKETGMAYLGTEEAKELHRIAEHTSYELVEGEPVVYYLGNDGKPGGRGVDSDVYWPEEYQPAVSAIDDFLAAPAFKEALVWGGFLGIGFSICLFGIWCKVKSPVQVTLLSLVFLVVELGMAGVIAAAHIYPTH